MAWFKSISKENTMVNKCTLLGYVGKQPEIKTFSNGGRGASLSIATSEKWTDKKTGEKREATEWHRISVFGALVDIVERYVNKGTLLYVEGKIKTRSYTHAGQDRRVTEIVLDGFGSVLQLVGNKPSQETAQPAMPVPGQSYRQQTASVSRLPTTAPQAHHNQAQAPAAYDDEEFETPF
jgi:single-strand DNA-binding protein